MSEDYVEAMLMAMESELGAQSRAYRLEQERNHYGLGKYAGAKEDKGMLRNGKNKHVVPRRASCFDPIADLAHFEGAQLSAALDMADIFDNGAPMPEDEDVEVSAEETEAEEYMQRVVEDLQAREGAEAIQADSAVRHFLNQVRAGRV